MVQQFRNVMPAQIVLIRQVVEDEKPDIFRAMHRHEYPRSNRAEASQKLGGPCDCEAINKHHK